MTEIGDGTTEKVEDRWRDRGHCHAAGTVLGHCGYWKRSDTVARAPSHYEFAAWYLE